MRNRILGPAWLTVRTRRVVVATGAAAAMALTGCGSPPPVPTTQQITGAATEAASGNTISPNDQNSIGPSSTSRAARVDARPFDTAWSAQLPGERLFFAGDVREVAVVVTAQEIVGISSEGQQAWSIPNTWAQQFLIPHVKGDVLYVAGDIGNSGPVTVAGHPVPEQSVFVASITADGAATVRVAACPSACNHSGNTGGLPVGANANTIAFTGHYGTPFFYDTTTKTITPPVRMNTFLGCQAGDGVWAPLPTAATGPLTGWLMCTDKARGVKIDSTYRQLAAAATAEEFTSIGCTAEECAGTSSSQDGATVLNLYSAAQLKKGAAVPGSWDSVLRGPGTSWRAAGPDGIGLIAPGGTVVWKGHGHFAVGGGLETDLDLFSEKSPSVAVVSTDDGKVVTLSPDGTVQSTLKTDMVGYLLADGTVVTGEGSQLSFTRQDGQMFTAPTTSLYPSHLVVGNGPDGSYLLAVQANSEEVWTVSRLVPPR